MAPLLRRLAASGALFAVALSTAVGAYLDSDYPGDSRKLEWPSEVTRPFPVPKPPSAPRNAVTDLIRKIEVGAPCSYAGLTVFPLVMSRAGSRDDIRTLDEALRNEWIVVREKDDAQVNELHVRNDSRHMVLLLAGEIVAGGRQNRVIRDDVLLPARSGFVGVPVYCVEQQRWDGRDVRFSSPASMTHQGLRQSAVAGESQDSIWKEAASKAESVGVTSRTRNYQEIYDDRDVKRRVDSAVSRFDRFVGRDTIGAVAVVGDRIISCDIFADPGLFSRLWSKLCRSYTIEDLAAIDGDSRRWHSFSTSVTSRDVERFLSDAFGADYDPTSTPGAGRALRISGSVTGGAIIWDDRTVHAALFPGYKHVPVPVLRREINPVPSPALTTNAL